MNEVPSAEFLKQLSVEGLESYKRDVLSGPTFKRVVNRIEDSALAGYTGWQQTLNNSDDIREFKVIQNELQSKGYYCEFETKERSGLLGAYKESVFHVKWDD